MSQTSNLGSQLGFPLGFNAFTGSSLTESISDTLSLSDSILLTNPIIPELVSDSISLSDSVAFTVGSATVIRITQEVVEVVTEDTASAAVRVTQAATEIITEDTGTAVVRTTQIIVEVVTEDFSTGITFLVSDRLLLSDSVVITLTNIILEVAPIVLEQGNGAKSGRASCM